MKQIWFHVFPKTYLMNLDITCRSKSNTKSNDFYVASIPKMFTSKSPELNINFLYQISAPLTSAFNLAWGFPPPPDADARDVEPWCSSWRCWPPCNCRWFPGRVENRPKWREFFLMFVSFVTVFFVGVCSRLMNDDVDISYTICLYLIYIDIYIYLYVETYIMFF